MEVFPDVPPPVIVALMEQEDEKLTACISRLLKDKKEEKEQKKNQKEDKEKQESFLKREYEKINYVNEKSVLNYYINKIDELTDRLELAQKDKLEPTFLQGYSSQIMEYRNYSKKTEQDET